MSKKYYVGDFETTVYTGQIRTEVWASALVPFYSEDVIILHSIDETFEYLINKHENMVIYYHNLKFDGSFWLDYLLRRKDFSLAYEGTIGEADFSFLSAKEMENNTYTYNISGMGQWYQITLKVNGFLIEFRDSLKLLPFSVSAIGKAFETKHKKLTMEYMGERYAGCEITEDERKYIANDVLVVKEALEIMFAEGHKKLTVGACCLDEFKTRWKHPTNEYPLPIPFMWEEAFPDLTKIELSKFDYGSINAEEYIRKSYHGGWCYLARGKENKEFHDGITLDVNSLYPSMMSGESGNKFPYGYPVFYKPNSNRIVPVVKDDEYYFIRFRCNFDLKMGKLPTVQIKNNKLYKSTEWLETSKIKAPDGKYYSYYKDPYGIKHNTRVEMTMTMTDYETFLKHYHVTNLEVLDWVVFKAEVGLFDNYINKYKKIKQESKGAKRTLAKLYLNNLYGKMATSPINNVKVGYIDDRDALNFHTFRIADKEPVYIPIGSAITSYARNFTIKAAQSNYHGKANKGFIYADTDSIHCNLPLSSINNVEIHDTDFCKWKCESHWDKAIFVRQKTYMEHIISDEKPYHDIKCAGMPQRCKNLLCDRLDTGEMKYTDFGIGLSVTGKLLPKRIKGGIVLQETTYVMH